MARTSGVGLIRGEGNVDASSECVGCAGSVVSECDSEPLWDDRILDRFCHIAPHDACRVVVWRLQIQGETNENNLRCLP